MLATGAIAVVQLSYWAGPSFVVGKPHARATPPRDGASRLARHVTSGSTTNSEGLPAPPKEASDLEKFLDRFNTRGGAIVGTVVALFAGLFLEKFLEVAGVESLSAGVYTSGLFFIILLVWLSQYLFRVFNKGTTYADQLKRYEQEVMMKRLSELDEDEIMALCAEVGVSNKDIEEALGDKRSALSQKEKVLQIFKNAALAEDPRAAVARGPDTP